MCVRHNFLWRKFDFLVGLQTARYGFSINTYRLFSYYTINTCDNDTRLFVNMCLKVNQSTRVATYYNV